MGYHQRTEYNKLIVKIGNNLKEINPNGGFHRYGLLKNDFVLIKGSLPGVRKRAVVLTEAVRPHKRAELFEITSLNLRTEKWKQTYII